MVGHNWPVYLNFQGGRGFSPFLGELLVLFPWGVIIILAGLVLGNLFHSAAVPLFAVILLPIFTTWMGGPSIILWCSMMMVLITLVTFLVLVDPKTGMNRIQHKDRDRLEQLDETFHQKVYEGYIQLWEQSPNRIHRINGNREQERVFEDIKDIINPMLAKR